MSSRHSIFVVLFGWLIAGTYIIYDYKHNGQLLVHHLFEFDDPVETFFHLVIVCTFIGSHVTAYLINERKKNFIKKRQSENQLKHSALEWMSTFDSMPYGILLSDNEGNIIRVNRYITDFSGRSAGELMSGKKCNEVICRLPVPPGNCSTVNAESEKIKETYEYKDEQSGRHFVESVTPMLNNEGQAVSRVHVLIDVTDSKEKEEKLTRSKDAFFNMLKDLDSTYNELKSVHDNLVITFSNILDAKSSWTRGHSMNVATYALAIADKLQLKSWDQETLRTAALLHDIGKVGTYDVILDKPGKLNDIERSLVQQHTIKGEEILSPIRGLEKVLPIVRSHHEKFDGTGYPDGLQGNEIPLLARVLCVADSFDAMISNRPYRLSMGRDRAISELRLCSDYQFDPKVVEAFLSTIEGAEGSALTH